MVQKVIVALSIFGVLMYASLPQTSCAAIVTEAFNTFIGTFQGFNDTSNKVFDEQVNSMGALLYPKFRTEYNDMIIKVTMLWTYLKQVNLAEISGPNATIETKKLQIDNIMGSLIDAYTALKPNEAKFVFKMLLESRDRE